MLNKTLLILLITTGFTACNRQEDQKIWMSYNDRVIDSIATYAGDSAGYIIDFEQSKMGHVSNDTLFAIGINFEENFITINSKTIDAEINVFGNDSIEMQLFENKISVFHPLSLHHKIDAEKSEIEDFLTNSQFEDFGGPLDLKFSQEQYIRDKLYEKPNNRKSLINIGWDDQGYWYIKEIQRNYFLIASIDQTGHKNIYQITSFDTCKMEVNQLEKPKFAGLKLKVLKTCL